MKYIKIKVEKENDYWLATTNVSELYGQGETPEKAINDLLTSIKDSETEEWIFKKSWTVGNTDYSMQVLIDK